MPREDDERVANEAPVAETLPVIKVHQRISLLTTEAQQMLIGAKVPFYQRGGELVRPIIRTVKAAHGHLTRTAQLKTINPIYMRDTMCRHAHWVRFDGRKNGLGPDDGTHERRRNFAGTRRSLAISGNRRRDLVPDHAARWIAAREAGL